MTILLCVITCVSRLFPDVSQTSGASGQEAAEGRGGVGAAGRVWGLRTLPHDEQQSRYRLHPVVNCSSFTLSLFSPSSRPWFVLRLQKHHEQKVSIHS